MADALDVPGNRDILTEQDEEFFGLLDFASPESICILCEEHDAHEGYERGTSLEMYLTAIRQTH